MAEFDFCIFGAGLAGVSLAKSLIERNQKVCLIDIKSVASGASGTPLGLVNPATGRYGTKVWKAEECLKYVQNNLEEVQKESDKIFFKKTGVLRPALKKEIAGRMQENLEKKEWEEGWCEWKTEEKIHELNPGLNCIDGGLWLPVGLTIDVAAYLNSAVEFLEKRGLKTFFNAKYVLHKAEDCWTISVNGFEHKITASSVIHTAGIDTKDVFIWDFLKLHAVKGQNATLKTSTPMPLTCSVSALGYIASLTDSEFVLGSTYEHTFNNRDPDEKGLNYLRERMSKVYPKLIEEGEVVDQWAGVRASTPNRKPVLGRHPELPDAFVFAGLGSKGLMYSAYLSERLSKHILDKEPLPRGFSVGRF